MGSFDDPSSSFEAGVVLYLQRLFATGFDVRLVVPPPEKLADVFGVIAFVEADILSSGCRLRTMDRNTVESGFEKFDIVSVGTTDFDS